MSGRSTQEKFLARMLALGAGLDLDVVIDRQHANTGVVRFQPEASFETSVSVTYSFQDTYASFEVRDGAGALLIPVAHGVGMCRYDDGFEGQIVRISEVIVGCNDEGPKS